MKEINHKITCLNPDCIGGRIETTMSGDNGYSNWTVLDDGEIEFKCHGCGKFATTDYFQKEEGNNQPENFEVKCLNCGSTDWDSNIQDVDEELEETHISCSECGAKTFELEYNND